MTIYIKIVKPIFDFLLSLIAMILLLPLFAIIILLLAFSHKGSPFFIQPRTGKHKKIFKIIKFKTMSDKRDDNSNLLPDAQRLTKIGKLLRNTSLDELPQLFNVLKGDMSWVGPRPLLTDYAHLYNEFQDRRHDVKPGITGWVQVNGRTSLTWEERFKMDVWYVENSSFLTDIKILFKTILTIFNRERVQTSSDIPIEPFEGEY